MNYQDFHEWLFPGDRIPNPLDIPPDADADDILREVSCQSGVPLDWLRRSTREVLEGVAGLQCLWFLHGAHGEISETPNPPQWFFDIINFIHQSILHDTEEQRKGIVEVYVHEENWPKGTVAFEKGYKRRKPVIQNYKIGRYIDAYADYMRESTGLAMFDAQQLHLELKNRAKDSVYQWWVSVDPVEVLTMSHGRPWPSCMKPGGLFEYGPLTDMAAGSAVFWLAPEGADSPSARIILRPYLENDGTPSIAEGGVMYGSGPSLNTDDLNAMLEPWLEGLAINRVMICPRGQNGLALTRAIYSDTDRLSGGCEQSMEQYQTAYENLDDAAWPAPQFEIETGRARELAEGHFWRDEEDEAIDAENAYNEAVRQLLEDASSYAGYGYFESTPSNLEVYQLYNDSNINMLSRELVLSMINNDNDGSYSAIAESDIGTTGIDDYIYDDITRVLKENLRGRLFDESINNFAIVTFPPKGVRDIKVRNAINTVPHLVSVVSPEDFEEFEPRMLHYAGNVEWVDGVPVDEDTGEEVGDVLITADWVLEEVPDITSGAINIDEGNVEPSMEITGNISNFLRGQ